MVVLGGARTPFTKFATSLSSVPAYELGTIAMKESLYRSEVKPYELDEVIFGNVASPPESANIARVIALMSGVPEKIPAFTVSRNCASGMESIADAFIRIVSGRANLIAAGGVENMSRIPLFFSDSAKGKWQNLFMAKTFAQKFKRLAAFKFRDFLPVVGLEVGLKDIISGLNMGETAEVLAKEFHISRRRQDEFALESYRKAERAVFSNRFKREIVPVLTKDGFVKEDNGIRKNQSMEALSKLKPYFDRKFGTVTAGNSSQITDGASCLILSSNEFAKKRGLPILGVIEEFSFVGCDPSRMGLGPAYAIPNLLNKRGLKISDIDIFEINEAFAAQVLACIDALSSKKWCSENLSIDDALGAIPEDKLNINGGAIALGHPVGASGNRLVLTILHELKARGLNLGITSLCIGGGQGAAFLLSSDSK